MSSRDWGPLATILAAIIGACGICGGVVFQYTLTNTQSTSPPPRVITDNNNAPVNDFTPEEEPQGETGNTATTLSAFDLEVGVCFNDRIEDTVTNVPVVACSNPHDNEVYFLVDYDTGATASFPGSDAIKSFADDECLAAFENYVDIEYSSSRLYYSYLYPTENSWENGDREVACILYDGDLEKLEGSMRGAEE